MHKTVNDLLTFTFENIPWYDQEYQVCVCSFYVLYYSLLQQGGGGGCAFCSECKIDQANFTD